MSRIAVLGAGAWGTALAISLARRGGHQLCLWAHSPEHARQLAETGENARYLPGYHPSRRRRNHSHHHRRHRGCRDHPLRHALAGVAFHHAADHAAPHPRADPALRLQGHRRENLPAHVAGHGRVHRRQQPHRRHRRSLLRAGGRRSHAHRLSIACDDPAVGTRLQNDFSSPSLRVYRNEDIPGTELGGALKNVIALAAGIVAGLELGHNAAAALITRGIAEISRLSIACGGRRETMAGLSGIGDLVLTCSSNMSRNRTVGVELGRGRKLPEILASLNGKVAEGVLSTTAALGLAARYGVEMPITEQMAAILHKDRSPRDAIRELMTRPGRTE